MTVHWIQIYWQKTLYFEYKVSADSSQKHNLSELEIKTQYSGNELTLWDKVALNLIILY